MKRKILIFAAAVLILTAGVLIWRMSMRRDEPPELIFPTIEAESTEGSVTAEASDIPQQTAESPAPATESTTAPTEEAAGVAHTLFTARDPLHYFRLTFDGNTITVDGVYEGYEVAKMALDSMGSVKPEQDGGHVSAQFVTDGTADSDKLTIYFASGSHIPVHIVYDENGLPQPLITDAMARSELALAHPITIPRDSVMEYILPEGSAEERSAVLEYIRDISERVCKGLESDYDKARALAMWVSKNIYYDYVAFETEVTVETLSLAKTLELQRSVCGGYANLYAALCQAQGITCHVVKGTCIQGGGTFAGGGHAAPSHEWNVLELDGRHIWVDTLWNTDNAYDGEYYYGDQKLRYFDISDECMAINHRAERVEIRKFYE